MILHIFGCIHQKQWFDCMFFFPGNMVNTCPYMKWIPYYSRVDGSKILHHLGCFFNFMMKLYILVLYQPLFIHSMFNINRM